jgi:hypothetical protein
MEPSTGDGTALLPLADGRPWEASSSNWFYPTFSAWPATACAVSVRDIRCRPVLFK